MCKSELLVSVMKKIGGVTVFVSVIKRMESYPDFEKLAHAIQHGIQGFIVTNIEGDSNDLCRIS